MRRIIIYFEKAFRLSCFYFGWLHTLSISQSSVGSQRQQDAKGSTPTNGVRFTVSRRRLSATATLMGVFTFLLPSTTLGYFRKPRNEANECEQQEVSCCCALSPASLVVKSSLWMRCLSDFQLSVFRGFHVEFSSGLPNFSTLFVVFFEVFRL